MILSFKLSISFCVQKNTILFFQTKKPLQFSCGIDRIINLSPSSSRALQKKEKISFPYIVDEIKMSSIDVHPDTIKFTNTRHTEKIILNNKCNNEIEYEIFYDSKKLKLREQRAGKINALDKVVLHFTVTNEGLQSSEYPPIKIYLIKRVININEIKSIDWHFDGRRDSMLDTIDEDFPLAEGDDDDQNEQRFRETEEIEVSDHYKHVPKNQERYSGQRHVKFKDIGVNGNITSTSNAETSTPRIQTSDEEIDCMLDFISDDDTKKFTKSVGTGKRSVATKDVETGAARIDTGTDSMFGFISGDHSRKSNKSVGTDEHSITTKDAETVTERVETSDTGTDSMDGFIDDDQERKPTKSIQTDKRSVATKDAGTDAKVFKTIDAGTDSTYDFIDDGKKRKPTKSIQTDKRSVTTKDAETGARVFKTIDAGTDSMHGFISDDHVRKSTRSIGTGERSVSTKDAQTGESQKTTRDRGTNARSFPKKITANIGVGDRKVRTEDSLKKTRSFRGTGGYNDHFRTIIAGQSVDTTENDFDTDILGRIDNMKATRPHGKKSDTTYVYGDDYYRTIVTKPKKGITTDIDDEMVQTKDAYTMTPPHKTKDVGTSVYNNYFRTIVSGHPNKATTEIGVGESQVSTRDAASGTRRVKTRDIGTRAYATPAQERYTGQPKVRFDTKATGEHSVKFRSIGTDASKTSTKETKTQTVDIPTMKPKRPKRKSKMKIKEIVKDDNFLRPPSPNRKRKPVYIVDDQVPGPSGYKTGKKLDSEESFDEISIRDISEDERFIPSSEEKTTKINIDDDAKHIQIGSEIFKETRGTREQYYRCKPIGNNRRFDTPRNFLFDCCHYMFTSPIFIVFLFLFVIFVSCTFTFQTVHP